MGRFQVQLVFTALPPAPVLHHRFPLLTEHLQDRLEPLAEHPVAGRARAVSLPPSSSCCRPTLSSRARSRYARRCVSASCRSRSQSMFATSRSPPTSTPSARNPRSSRALTRSASGRRLSSCTRARSPSTPESVHKESSPAREPPWIRAATSWSTPSRPSHCARMRTARRHASAGPTVPGPGDQRLKTLVILGQATSEPVHDLIAQGAVPPHQSREAGTELEIERFPGSPLPRPYRRNPCLPHYARRSGRHSWTNSTRASKLSP